MLHSAEESKNYAEQLREDNNTIAIIDYFAFSMLSDCSYVVPCAVFPDSAPVFFRRRKMCIRDSLYAGEIVYMTDENIQDDSYKNQIRYTLPHISRNHMRNSHWHS